jgi:hypothetical protein
MADLAKSRDDLITDFASNGQGLITAQEVRNFIMSVMGMAYKVSATSECSPDSNTGYLFTMDVNGSLELFFKNANGDIVQITNINGTTIDAGATSMLNFITGEPTLPTIQYLQGEALSDGVLADLTDTTWDTHVVLKHIQVTTTSTDWDLTIYDDSDGVSTKLYGSIDLIKNASGDVNMALDMPYIDNDDSNEIHVKFTDNGGSAGATITLVAVKAKE